MSAAVYVVTHPDLQSVKIGCSSKYRHRLKHLNLQGWMHYRALAVSTPDVARAVEQAALFQVRHRLGVPAHLTPDLISDGWSETSSARLLPPASAWGLLCDAAATMHLQPFTKRSIRNPSAAAIHARNATRSQALASAVETVRQDGLSAAETAVRFKVTERTARRWVKAARPSAHDAANGGRTAALRARNRERSQARRTAIDTIRRDRLDVAAVVDMYQVTERTARQWVKEARA